MAEFLLVHGSCHGAWCWRDLTASLGALGHKVRAIDLPAMGDDPTPVASVTFDHDRLAVLSALDAARQPVILVGHSAGGYPASAAAASAPDKVAHLVYLCAYTPAAGKSLAARRAQAPRQPLLASVIRSADARSYTIAPGDLRRLFYGDCPDEVIDLARRRLSPQPVAPQETPFGETAALDALAKSYIRCARDGAIPAEFQARMAADWPDMARYDIDSDHSPFYSRPARLAAILDEIADTT